MKQVNHVRRDRGDLGYRTGLAAEDIVARDYCRRGLVPAARRWRGVSGEVDLVFRDGETVVFVEVKKARTLSDAAHRLGARQIERIFGAATEFVAGEPKGQLTDMRFDLALVDGSGRTEIRENGLAA